MSHKKPQEKNANAPPSEGKPPAQDAPTKDPFAEAAAKLEQDGAKLEQELNQAGPTTSAGDLKPEGVKIGDLPALPQPHRSTDPLSSFTEHGFAAQAQTDSTITYTPGDAKPKAVETEAMPDLDSLVLNLLTVASHAIQKINAHRDYFLNKPVPANGKLANPYGPAQAVIVRFYNSFNTMAGNRGLKSE